MTTEERIDELAAKLGVHNEARRLWRKRGHVPYRWRDELRDAAAQEGWLIPREVFDNFGRADG
jgi:hypothetical protein